MKAHRLPLLRRSALTALRFATLALLIGCLPTACSKKDDASPQVTCKLTSRTYQASGNPQTDTREYMADGQPKSVVSSGGSRTNYAYGADGYLTTLTRLSSGGAVSSTDQFEFTSGRLTKATTKNSAGTTTYTTQYEYDGAGSLTKAVEQYVGSSTYTYIFSGGKQTGYIAKSSSGAESQPCTFENGLVKRFTSGTSQSNYEYDAQGRRTRYETLNSGKVTNYTVYEYTDGASIMQSYSSFKGVPAVFVNGYNETGTDVGLATKTTIYTVSSTNVTTKYSEAAVTYTKNASGFPTEANFVERYYTVTGSVSSTNAYKYTYSYTGCQ